MSKNKVDLKTLAEQFSMLSDATRLGILAQLSAGPKNVTAMCATLGRKRPAASHHLGLLKMTGIATAKRTDKTIMYTLNPGALDEAKAFLADL
jgi:DNA-binding transcriptional ArsR family regulator